MKKLFVVLLMAVAFCGSAEAQKGMKGIGVNINGNVTNELLNIGASAKFQYNLTDYIRVEASAGGYALIEDNYPNNKKSGFELTALADTHFFVLSPRRIRPYFIAGVGYSSFKQSYEYKSNTYGGYSSHDNIRADGFTIHLGVGADWRITSRLSLQAEFGGLMLTSIDSAKGAVFGIGTCYNF